MFCENKFHAVRALKEKSIADIAQAIGTSKATLYRKIKGKSDFTRNEIALISQFLKISNDEMNDIFLAEMFRKRNNRSGTVPQRSKHCACGFSAGIQCPQL